MLRPLVSDEMNSLERGAERGSSFVLLAVLAGIDFQTLKEV